MFSIYFNMFVNNLVIIISIFFDFSQIFYNKYSKIKIYKIHTLVYTYPILQTYI